MKTLRFSLLLLLCLSLQAYGKDQLIIKQLCVVSKQAVNSPYLIDSTDVNGVKFTMQNFVKNFVPPIISDYSSYSTITAAADSTFKFTKPDKASVLQYFEFRVYANRFTKTKLSIASTGDCAVFVNGVKKETTASSELSLPKGTTKSVELSMIPQYCTIGVCCMTNQKDSVLPALKIALSGDNTRLVEVPLNGSQGRKLSYEDIINVNAPTGVSISYNGTYVMIKSTATLPGGDKVSALEVVERAGGKRVMQLTDRMNLGWMPKSEKLYFIEKQAGVRQLKVIDPRTLDTKVIAKNIPEGHISWSPDETYLIITGTDKYTEKTSDTKYYILPQDRFAGWRNGSYLTKFDLATGATQQLTYGHQDLSLQDISKDGKKLIFRVSENTITKRPFLSASFFQYDLTSHMIDTLWSKVAFVNSVQYSPDGRQLVVLGAPAAFNKLGENMGKRPISNDYDVQAYLYDFASKKVQAITKDFDPTIQQAQWNEADNSIYFKVTDRDYERVYRYSVTNAKFEKLPLPVDMVQQLDLSGNGLYAAYRGVTATYPAKAFALNLATKESTVLSDPEKEKMSQIKLNEVTDYNFKGKDGVTIYGRYYLPVDFDKTKKYPMIVYYYGGTTPTQRSFSSNWNFNYWATLGYVVYVVQPSGAIGFGQEFSARHVNAWGIQTADDIIQGVKSFAASHSFVNEKKIGCLGASYGGFMTMYLQTKTNIFATAISHAGISALSSYWGDGYWGYEYSGVASADTYPWNNPKFYTEQSPLFNAHKINTPMLLMQGEVDTNVPVGESMQMFTALKILGKPVEMIRIKNEDHIITEYKHRTDWNYSIMAWMAKYLQDDNTWWENLYPESKEKK